MARYGKGGYNEWKENKVSSYDIKTEGDAYGLKGWQGNKTVEYEAKKLAEQFAKPGADYGKGSIWWDKAMKNGIRIARQGGDPHGEYRDHLMSEEIADLRSQLDNADSKSDIKEEIEKPESALEILRSAEREEALEKIAGFEDDRDADGGVEIFNGEWDPNRKYTTDTGRGKSFLDSYSANLKKGIKDVKRQLA